MSAEYILTTKLVINCYTPNRYLETACEKNKNNKAGMAPECHTCFGDLLINVIDFLTK